MCNISLIHILFSHFRRVGGECDAQPISISPLWPSLTLSIYFLHLFYRYNDIRISIMAIAYTGAL